jgi:peptidoglycan/LPS O-acetylase OafA/YrhL
MTPEQVTRLKGWTYALFGGGIACFFTAYQYAQPVVGIAEPPPEWAPYLFGGIGIVCIIVAGILALKTGRSGTPAAVADLSSPKGKTVKILMAVGVVALVALILVDFVAPGDDMTWMAVSVVLLLIVAGCFVTAGHIARKLRAVQSTK